MKAGDLVRAIPVKERNIGLILKIDRSSTTMGYSKRYWVKLLGRPSGPFPFLEHQLKVLSGEDEK